MAQLSPKLRSVQGGGVAYWCEGCDSSHVVMTGQGPGPRWTWDGNIDAPTFRPSVHVMSGHYVRNWKTGDPCWCNAAPEDRWPLCINCHTIITAGMVDFLGDCSYAFAGQIRPLPDLVA